MKNLDNEIILDPSFKNIYVNQFSGENCFKCSTPLLLVTLAICCLMMITVYCPIDSWNKRGLQNAFFCSLDKLSKWCDIITGSCKNQYQCRDIMCYLNWEMKKKTFDKNKFYDNSITNELCVFC